MEIASSATQNAKSISVLDAVIWIAGATKKVSPQTVQRCFQKAGVSTEWTYNKIDDSNTQKLQESLDQATYQSVTVDDYLNFNDSHQNSKEDDDDVSS
jgi:hypothetical protein